MLQPPFNIAQRLLELRKQAALYQEEFAELVDLPWKTLQAIENGRRRAVRLDTLEKIALGYGIELWQLFHPELPKPSTKRQKAISEIMKRRSVIRW